MTQPSSTSYFKPDDNTIKQWFAQLQEFKSNGTFCDITLKAEDKEIRAHRVILAMSIPFFSRMLQSNFRETTNEKVEIKEIEPAALDSLVNLSYGVEMEINQQNAEKLLIGADYLQLLDVKKACENFLKTHLTPESVLETKKIAKKLYCNDLVSTAEKFIDKNFPDLAKTDEFLDLEKHELIDIIKRDELRVREEEVYEAVMKWIKYEGPERIELLPEVLSYVRLCLLSPEFLCNSVSKESLIKASPECRDLLDEARDYHMITSVPKSISCRPRHFIGKLYVLGGQNSDGSVSSLQIYDFREDEWTIKDSAEAILLSGSAVLDGKLYIFGGLASYQRLSDVKIFDLKTEKFSVGRNMSSTNNTTAAAVLGDCIHVCGGFNSYGALNFHQRYSPKLDVWTELAPLIKKRYGHGMVELNGQIYVVGGFGSSYLNSCERYDPVSNTWSIIKSMEFARHCPGVAVLNGKIYVCGGERSEVLNSVEVYDSVQDVWTQAAPMNVERYGHVLVSDGRKLYAIGGKSKKDVSTCLSSVEVYDPETDSWSFGASLPEATTFMNFGISAI